MHHVFVSYPQNIPCIMFSFHMSSVFKLVPRQSAAPCFSSRGLPHISEIFLCHSAQIIFFVTVHIAAQTWRGNQRIVAKCVYQYVQCYHRLQAQYSTENSYSSYCDRNTRSSVLIIKCVSCFWVDKRYHIKQKRSYLVEARDGTSKRDW